MKKITVKASREYDVIIEKGILLRVGEYAKGLNLFGKACIVSDTNVAPLYLERVKNSLENEGYEVFSYVFSAGEESKNAKTYIDMLNFLAKNHFTRNDTLFALGGGVTGDLTGFCAASYMRGINFVQLPTTLLAAVDSSVGGKTGINLERGKNLAGAFYQPKTVLFDTEALKTLPREVFEDGMAEVIKYAMISEFNADITKSDIEEIICQCVTIKRDIVCEDEFEGGVRRLLNFGHTIGHAIEKASDYKISHGRAVAKGMYIITKAAEKKGLCRKGTLSALSKLLEEFSLKTDCPYNKTELFNIIKNDKKAEGDGVNLIIPKAFGKCEVIKATDNEITEILNEGLE